MTTLKKGDIIWAKMRGYPWWPARYVGLQEHKSVSLVKVKFINDNSHAFVAISQVVAYKDKREEYGKTKRKTLMRSIHCADKLVTSGSRIQLEDQSSATECKIESKELTGKRKLIISDSEDETPNELEERSMVKDMEKLLEQVINKKNPDSVIPLEPEHKKNFDMITKEIEDGLEEFINFYSDIPLLKKICRKATELLKNLESTSRRGESQEMGIAMPHKLKRLKRSESIEMEDSIEQEETIQDTPKNKRLMVTVCQELAKVIEEVKSKCNT
jgi:ribosomal protein L35AE/L33A